MKTTEEILKAKFDYYGKTEAAIEFAMDEYAREYHQNELSKRKRVNK